MADDTAVHRLHLATADGVALEAECHVPDNPTAAVVLAHPHPAQGGSMRSLVTSELFTSLPRHGLATLRFNFRGVEGSEGEHDGGHAEQLDIVAALDVLAARAAGCPLILAGWSFGADTSLAVTDDRIDGWAAIAPPLRILPIEELTAASDPRPKLLVVPEHDAFNPPSRCERKTRDWVATRIEVIAGGDHFLVGRTAKVAQLVVGFADDLSSGDRTAGGITPDGR